MLPLVRIRTDADLTKLVEAMRAAARAEVVREPPVYSNSPQEAITRAQDVAEILLSDGKCRIVSMMGHYVTVILTIEGYGTTPSWHLSMSTVPLEPGREPGRVPNPIAERVARGFGMSDEGPSEGAFKAVRHFRGHWTPD